MKIMTCPVNGARAISEFAYGGPVLSMPDPQITDDAAWADYVYNRSCVPGIQQEWWCHIPSTIWFIAERDTQRDVVLRTYLYGEAAAVSADMVSGTVPEEQV